MSKSSLGGARMGKTRKENAPSGAAGHHMVITNTFNH